MVVLFSSVSLFSLNRSLLFYIIIIYILLYYFFSLLPIPISAFVWPRYSKICKVGALQLGWLATRKGGMASHGQMGITRTANQGPHTSQEFRELDQRMC
jgi:hypothetical protein